MGQVKMGVGPLTTLIHTHLLFLLLNSKFKIIQLLSNKLKRLSLLKKFINTNYKISLSFGYIFSIKKKKKKKRRRVRILFFQLTTFLRGEFS